MTPQAKRALLIVLAVTGLAAPSRAQMMLPGANNGNAIGAPPKPTGIGASPSGGLAAAPLRPIPIKPPAVATILGHALSLDGHQGTMVFDTKGGGLSLTRLRFVGEKISRPQQSCTVDVSLASDLRTTPAGEPDGTLRYEVPLEACPFAIDILDGAVLVTRPDPTCEFKAADCRVSPGGLWGPPASEITAARAKDLEHQRVRIETVMRTDFRALMKKAGKDKAAVKAIARDQAAFSSEREMTCRDYDQEAVHGFCATQITEARALALLARFGAVEKTERPHAAVKPRPKPRKPVSRPVSIPPVAPPSVARPSVKPASN